MTVEHWCSDCERWNTEVLQEKALQVTLSTTNHTWTGLKSNLGVHGEKMIEVQMYILNKLESRSGQ
jgi:hypothetical protein